MGEKIDSRTVKRLEYGIACFDILFFYSQMSFSLTTPAYATAKLQQYIVFYSL